MYGETYRIRTTINPDVEYVVEEAEYLQLKELGLLVGEPLGPESPGVLDQLMAEIADDPGSAFTAVQRAAFRSEIDAAIDDGTIGGGDALSTSGTALIKLFGSLANRDAEPVIVHVDGDSFTGFLSTGMWPTRLSALLQTAYPKVSGTSPPITSDVATARSSRGTGAQVVNTAVSGQASANFLTEEANVAALQPAAYIWMIGTNDAGAAVTAATYKTNLLARIAYQKANNPRPVTFILVRTYRRPDQSVQALWDQYGVALAEIAAADPNNVVYLDLAPVFARLGVPGPDPLNLVQDGDNLHPTDQGQALHADLIWSALRLTAPLTAGPATQSGGSPILTNTAAPAITGTAATGQTLTVSNGTWSTTPDSYSRQWKRGGTAISGATSQTYVLVPADEGQAITCTVTATKTGYVAGSATSNAATPPASEGGGGGGIVDTFNRADDATSLGTPSDGGAPYVTLGTWGISGNAAYGVATGSNNYAVRPLSAGAAVTDATVQAVFAGSGFNNLSLALLNPANVSGYMLYQFSQLELWKRSSTGTYTLIASFAGQSVAAGDTLKLVKSGSSLSAFKNGTQLGTTQTDATIATVTHGGLLTFAANSSARIDTLTLSTP